MIVCAIFADDIPSLRVYVLAPMGIPRMIKDLRAMANGTNRDSRAHISCYAAALGNISSRSRYLSSLDIHELCSSLVQLLMYEISHSCGFEWEKTQIRYCSRSDYSALAENFEHQSMNNSLILQIFHNFTLFWESKEIAVNAITDELIMYLSSILSGVGSFISEWSLLQSRSLIEDLEKFRRP